MWNGYLWKNQAQKTQQLECFHVHTMQDIILTNIVVSACQMTRGLLLHCFVSYVLIPTYVLARGCAKPKEYKLCFQPIFGHSRSMSLLRWWRGWWPLGLNIWDYRPH